MCNPVSGITRSDGTVFMPASDQWLHSHTEIAKLHGIPDGVFGDKYARWELTPEDGDFLSDPDTWALKLDEARAPAWWTEDAPALEDKARREVKRYMEAASAAHVAPQSPMTTSGDMSNAATSGDRSNAATSGDRSNAATSGDRSNAATSGDRSNAATSGDMSNAATSGYMSNAATSGYMSNAATSGYMSNAATSGDMSNAATSGDRSNAATSGKESPAFASGRDCRVKCGESGVLVCAERDTSWNLIGWVFGVAGKDGIKPNQWYKAEGGKLVEADDDITRDADARIAEAMALTAKPEGGAA